jgi:VWFA-related protein
MTCSSKFPEEKFVMRLRATALLALIAGLAGSAPGQDAGAGRVVVRNEARAVLLDAVVTDRNGNYVRDLAARDFRVLEDEKEVTVATAAFQATSDPRPKSYLILLFDNAALDAAAQNQARQAAAGILDLAGAEDRMTAVAAFGGNFSMLRDFTADAGSLKQAVAMVPPVLGAQARALPDAEDRLARSFLFSLAALARNVAALPGRKTLVLFSAGFPVRAGSSVAFRAALDACNRANLAIYPVEMRGPSAPRGSLIQRGGVWAGLLSRAGTAFAAGPALGIAQFMMAGMPSGQQSTPRTRNLPGTLPGWPGTSTSAPASAAPAVSLSTGQPVAMEAPAVLSALATGTGGILMSNPEGLESIVRETREYYLITYSPPENFREGCHALRLKVNRGGATVRSRHAHRTGNGEPPRRRRTRRGHGPHTRALLLRRARRGPGDAGSGDSHRRPPFPGGSKRVPRRRECAGRGLPRWPGRCAPERRGESGPGR